VAATTWILPVYCVNPTKEELQQGLKNVGRFFADYPIKRRDEGISCVENADYQTQANAFRSLFNKQMKQ